MKTFSLNKKMKFSTVRRAFGSLSFLPHLLYANFDSDSLTPSSELSFEQLKSFHSFFLTLKTKTLFHRVKRKNSRGNKKNYPLTAKECLGRIEKVTTFGDPNNYTLK